MTLKLSSKGQVVIPSSVRKKYNMRTNSKLELLDLGGELILVPLPKDPFKAARGILKGRVSTEDLLAMRRRDREREALK